VYECHYCIQKHESGQNIHCLSSWLEFGSSVFLGDFDTFEGIIHSVGNVSEQHPKMFMCHKCGVCNQSSLALWKV